VFENGFFQVIKAIKDLEDWNLYITAIPKHFKDNYSSTYLIKYCESCYTHIHDISLQQTCLNGTSAMTSGFHMSSSTNPSANSREKISLPSPPLLTSLFMTLFNTEPEQDEKEHEVVMVT